MSCNKTTSKYYSTFVGIGVVFIVTYNMVVVWLSYFEFLFLSSSAIMQQDFAQ
jgi:hypothetical protein